MDAGVGVGAGIGVDGVEWVQALDGVNADTMPDPALKEFVWREVLEAHQHGLQSRC